MKGGLLGSEGGFWRIRDRKRFCGEFTHAHLDGVTRGAGVERVEQGSALSVRTKVQVQVLVGVNPCQQRRCLC